MSSANTSSIDVLGSIELVFYSILLVAYLLSFEVEGLRFLKRERLRNFPILSYLIVLIIWIAVLGCTWERSTYVDITSISVASVVIELMWLLSLGVFLIQLYKFQDHQEGMQSFAISTFTIGLTLVLILCVFGLIPIHYGAATVQSKTVQGFITFLRVSIYVDYVIHIILFIVLYSKYILKNMVLWPVTGIALGLVLLCACLFNFFPVQELLQFFITMWLMVTIFHAFIITNYKNTNQFAPRTTTNPFRDPQYRETE